MQCSQIQGSSLQLMCPRFLSPLKHIHMDKTECHLCGDALRKGSALRTCPANLWNVAFQTYPMPFSGICWRMEKTTAVHPLPQAPQVCHPRLGPGWCTTLGIPIQSRQYQLCVRWSTPKSSARTQTPNQGGHLALATSGWNPVEFHHHTYPKMLAGSAKVTL